MKETIRVLYISNNENVFGGAPKSIYDIISNLDHNKVTPYFASTYNGDLAKNIINLGVPFLQLPSFSKQKPHRFILEINTLIQFIEKNKINIIHNNQSKDTLYSLLPAKLTNTPLITHHRDQTFYRLDKILSRLVTANIAISSWQNKQYFDNKAILIHNGIPMGMIPKEIPLKSKNNYRIGLVGRIAPMKGQDTFIKAASIVHKYNQEIEFKIIGDDSGTHYPDFLNNVKKMVCDFSLEKSVQFVGYVKNLEEIYSSLDISVIPSRCEPFGKTIIESMAYALPVIGTNTGGALDIITKQTGLIVPVDDEKALAEAIIYLQRDPNLCFRMGAAGHERVKQNFTIERTISKLVDLYYTILGTK